MEQPRVIWRKPLWQRTVIAVVAIGLDAGMIALIANGSAGTWQPWFFLLAFTIGLAGWWLPRTVLGDRAVTSRGPIGLSRTVALEAVTGVGYGPLGVWVAAATASGSPSSDGDSTMILHAVQGMQPVAGVTAGQRAAPSGRDAAALVRDRAVQAGSQLAEVGPEPSTPPRIGSLWSRLR